MGDNIASAARRDGSIDRVDIMRRLKVVGGTPELIGDSVCEVNTADYVDPAYFERELEVLFRRYPTYVGLTAEMPNPGDYKTRSIGGVPVIIVRGKDGVVRGFRNTCSHRGAPLLTEPCGNGALRMTCRYHSWSYDAQGTLVGINLPQGFPQIDKKDHGLKAIQVQEKFGLIFAVVDADAPFDLERHLGTLGPELDSIGLGKMLPAAEESVVSSFNWKLAVDTFGESYHLTSLHPQVANVLYGNGSIIDSYGAHTRLVVPLEGIKGLVNEPESKWGTAEAGVHFMLHYLIFPSLVVNLRDGAVQIIYIEPGASVGEVKTTQTQAFAPDLPAEKRAIYEGFFNLSLHGLTVPDDYTMCAEVYKSFRAGSLDKAILGRCEWMLHVLHRERERLMNAPATSGKTSESETQGCRTTARDNEGVSNG